MVVQVFVVEVVIVVVIQQFKYDLLEDGDGQI